MSAATLLHMGDVSDGEALDVLAGTVTVVSVLYRDAANHKRDGQYRLSGTFTAEHVTRLCAALDEGSYFIPTQIGMDHLGDTFDTGFPTRDDHVWHELDVDDIGPGAPGWETWMSVEEFVSVIEEASAQGWDELAAAAQIGLDEIDEH